MNRRKIYGRLFEVFLSGLVVCGGWFLLSGQTRQTLERKKARLQKEIATLERQLQTLRQQEEASLSRWQTLHQKLERQKQLRELYQQELESLQEEIFYRQQVMNALERDLQKTRKTYGRLLQMLYFLYLREQSDELFPVRLLATSPAQYRMYRFYVLALMEASRKQAELITHMQEELGEEIRLLTARKRRADSLARLLQQQEEAIQQGLREQEELVQKLRARQKYLLQEVRRKKQELEALHRKIEEIIRREMEQQKKLAQEKELDAMSREFLSQKGKLPFPVMEGVVVERFGTRPHPVLRGVQIQNNGIDIQTRQGAEVRAVYHGTISSVVQSGLFGYAVLVKHGTFYTVYSGLQEVYVEAGQSVQQGDVLGRLPAQGTPRLHFELWRGTQPLNPEGWFRIP